MLADINGCQLWFETRGDGEPLLLLHGFMGVGANWQLVFPDDAAGFLAIVPDLRGHGRSTNPPGTFTFRQAALDIFALLDHLGIDAVKAIGLSGGGITLLHMATQQPSRIAAMVVVSAPPYFPAEAKAIQRRYSVDLIPASQLAAIRAWHVRGDEQIESLVAQTRAMAANDADTAFSADALAAITADTLVVFGDRERFGAEPMYPVSLAFELHAAIPRSFLWVVPNGGHGPIFGPHAAAFADTSLRFLRGEWRADEVPKK
jgi:pimeloyl-ACP methyl ester carboxylesterase